MIPILYEASETTFTSNGLGRLRDILVARCVEERNGVFELDFDYPVDGAHYDEIKAGRIVYATHDDTGIPQPFDIVSYSRPINGVVSVHCVHVSYRQTGLTVYGTNINSLSDAFAMLANAEPNNPFTYSADFSSSAFMASADGTPRTVRQFLGGIEGSILDTYGGEYEFDGFNVILHKERGVVRDWSIRYGVNMTEYNEDADFFGTYTSCVPYWTGTDTNGADVRVVGDRVDYSGDSYNGRNDCVPLDLTDKFETKPTKAQVEAEALRVMNAQRPNLPATTIEVNFLRLQDAGITGFDQLLACHLCDTVNVVYPFGNATGQYKIVRTEWDVVADRYIGLTLGTLSTTLSEALGITEALEKSTGVDQIVAQVEALDDRVDAVETWQTTPPLFVAVNRSASIGTVAGGGWKTDITINFNVPSGYTALAGCCWHNSGYLVIYNYGWAKGATSVSPRFHNVTSTSASGTVYAYVVCIRNDLD